MFQCAQKGCHVPDDQAGAELCPVCNHPLTLVVVEPEVSQEKLDGIESPDYPEMVTALLDALQSASVVIASYSTIGAAPLNVDVSEFLADIDELSAQVVNALGEAVPS